jgi:hypothetical protein
MKHLENLEGKCNFNLSVVMTYIVYYKEKGGFLHLETYTYLCLVARNKDHVSKFYISLPKLGLRNILTSIPL